MGSFNAFNPSMLAGLAAAVAVVATGMIADSTGGGWTWKAKCPIFKARVAGF